MFVRKPVSTETFATWLVRAGVQDSVWDNKVAAKDGDVDDADNDDDYYYGDDENDQKLMITGKLMNGQGRWYSSCSRDY